MKKAYRITVTLLLILALTALSACSNSKKSNGGKDGSPVTITVLHNWNGSAGPQVNPKTTPIFKEIMKKTGIYLDISYAKKSEVETANEAFATGNLPDIYDGPAWGGEAQVLLKAANEGQLVDLSKYLDKYPNLKKLTQKKYMSQTLWDTVFKKQKGGQYFITEMYPATNDDVQDWMYGLWVRKDIAKKFGVAPQSIKTKEDLYNFLMKIKQANLSENGKNVFPMGSYGNGFALAIMSNYFAPIPGDTGWIFDKDGKATMNFMSKNWDDYTLFMRKLLKNGLLDPESFTQSDPIAKEKVNQGRYAVVPTQFNQMYESTRQWAQENPDKNFVPLGPIEDVNGERFKTVFNVQGSQLIAITKKCKDVDAALKVLNFLASDEGYLLTHYGIKGVHYDMVDGKPKAKKEWVDKLQKDQHALENQGIIGGLSDMAGFYRDVSLGGGSFGSQYDKKFQVQKEYKKIMRPDGFEKMTGTDPNTVVQNSENYDQLKPIFDTLGDVWRQAVYAKTDQGALDILNKTREALKQSGIDKVSQKITKMAKNGTTFVTTQTPN
ncbi:ABC transporter substrate-binding protein [Camelliibacillus cellulosilyticus]|uniref:ABC transporter substrate-binding protein n=1 Tax=Camelliibacillus cellulosilyticus TaxID=2174486 RepID=A0ABV9GQ86_9BACL